MAKRKLRNRNGKCAAPVARRALLSEQDIDNIVYNRMAHFLSDVEYRVKQAYEVANRRVSEAATMGKLYAEDLVSTKHMITGYTVTANSPGAGSIAWTSVRVVYAGNDYGITDANSALKYHWFVKPATYTAPDGGAAGAKIAMMSSNTKPVLAPGDCLLFVNNAGVPLSVLESSIAGVVADGAVDTNSILAGAVGATQIANLAITGAQLAAGAVTAGKVGVGGVSAANQFAGGVVDNTALANLAVDGGKLAAGAVTAGKIGVGGVSAANQYAAGTVDAAAIADLGVGTAELAAGAVTNPKLGTGAVQSGNILAGAVGATALGSGAVTPVKLNTNVHSIY